MPHSSPSSTTRARPRRPFRMATAAVLGLSLMASACAPGRDLQPLAEAQPAAYRLGVGDEIRVTTFGEDQLGGEFRVNDAGNIAFPLLGSVKAAGLTSSELSTQLAAEMKRRQLLRDPNVVAQVQTYRPVFVLGEVARPGEYPYRPGMTMLTAVAVAGGFTYRAVTDRASVVRITDGKGQEGLVARQSLIQPGDVINVFERRF
ncbi:MAG: polysaccharide export protein [Azospirillum brasilense]|nr:MAG: polysaccharide export protein [Azospirillum brasilense]